MPKRVVEYDPEYGVRLHSPDDYEDDFLRDGEASAYGHRLREVPEEVEARYESVYAQWIQVQDELFAIYLRKADSAPAAHSEER